VKTRSREKFSRIRSEISAFLTKSAGEDATRLGKNLSLFSGFAEVSSFKPDLVIESVIESLEAKKDVFSGLDVSCIVTSNTSSIPVNDLARYSKSPAKFAGLHFFNPVDRMQLVEVIPSAEMGKADIERLKSFCIDMGKTPIVVGDGAGFVVNRIMAPLLNEAALAYERKLASAEEIDKAVQLGLNHPMGPLRLLDLIGLDVFVEIMNSIRKETGEDRFRPAKAILKLVSEGKLGKKTGEGFYKY
jgi:3-hydroxybutyryl-CoA dehydrogenase